MFSDEKAGNFPLVFWCRGPSNLQPWSPGIWISFSTLPSTPLKTLHWTGSGKQEEVTVLDILVEYLHARKWKINPIKKSTAFYLTKSDPMAWDLSTHSSHVEGHIAVSGPTYH
jgi:hypothetical protein